MKDGVKYIMQTKPKQQHFKMPSNVLDLKKKKREKKNTHNNVDFKLEAQLNIATRTSGQ